MALEALSTVAAPHQGGSRLGGPKTPGGEGGFAAVLKTVGAGSQVVAPRSKEPAQAGPRPARLHRRRILGAAPVPARVVVLRAPAAHRVPMRLVAGPRAAKALAPSHGRKGHEVLARVSRLTAPGQEAPGMAAPPKRGVTALVAPARRSLAQGERAAVSVPLDAGTPAAPGASSLSMAVTLTPPAPRPPGRTVAAPASFSVAPGPGPTGPSKEPAPTQAAGVAPNPAAEAPMRPGTVEVVQASPAPLSPRMVPGREAPPVPVAPAPRRSSEGSSVPAPAGGLTASLPPAPPGPASVAAPIPVASHDIEAPAPEPLLPPSPPPRIEALLEHPNGAQVTMAVVDHGWTLGMTLQSSSVDSLAQLAGSADELRQILERSSGEGTLGGGSHSSPERRRTR
jgi:hypothetical protein